MKPTFGATLRKTRLARGYGLREFAAKVGVSPTYLSLAERGKSPTPTVARVEQMAELLGADAYQWLAASGRLPEKIAALLAGRPDLTTFLLFASRLPPYIVLALTDEIAGSLPGSPRNSSS